MTTITLTGIDHLSEHRSDLSMSEGRALMIIFHTRIGLMVPHFAIEMILRIRSQTSE
jgi:hypothetical protein